MRSGLFPHSAFAGAPTRDYTARSFSRTPRSRRAFTLVELLVVMAIISILLLLLVPAFTQIGTARNLAKGAYDVSGLLEQARAYAKANSTYTWVGFFEENADQTAGTAGTGRIILSLVASKDGTAMYPVSGDGTALDPLRLVQIAKLVKIENAHLDALKQVDIPSLTTVPLDDYQVSKDNFGQHVTPPSTTPADNKVTFYYPTGASSSKATYTFKKIIQFSPLGDATKIVDTPTQIIEIGLRPTHGSVTVANNKNCAAIQVSGIGGEVRIYRP